MTSQKNIPTKKLKIGKEESDVEVIETKLGTTQVFKMESLDDKITLL